MSCFYVNAALTLRRVVCDVCCSVYDRMRRGEERGISWVSESCITLLLLLPLILSQDHLNNECSIVQQGKQM